MQCITITYRLNGIRQRSFLKIDRYTCILEDLKSELVETNHIDNKRSYSLLMEMMTGDQKTRFVS